MTGEEAYAEDCRRQPDYPAQWGLEAAPRPAWSQLPEYAQWSWNRNPTPRGWRQRA